MFASLVFVAVSLAMAGLVVWVAEWYLFPRVESWHILYLVLLCFVPIGFALLLLIPVSEPVYLNVVYGLWLGSSIGVVIVWVAEIGKGAFRTGKSATNAVRRRPKTWLFILIVVLAAAGLIAYNVWR